MIQYRTTLNQLKNEIEQKVPGWLARADARTAVFRAAGSYSEASSIWSEVKTIYMQLQGGSKCAFCERKLESIDYGAGEQDVEHFRPKSNVRQWPVPQELTLLGVTCAAVPAEGGYYLLPYHPFNYSAACKPCNSVLKRDYFPVSDHHDCSGDDPVQLLSEKPLLLYPIGDFDTAPESVLEFYGVVPMPAPGIDQYSQQRAAVTIEFFKLADAQHRKNLIRERAFIIAAMLPVLNDMANGATDQIRTDGADLVSVYTASSAPHANCARSFKRLFETNPVEARTVHQKALSIIKSIS